MSLELVLTRIAYMPTVTLGRLAVPGLDRELATLERPWIPNPAGPGGVLSKSCVPDGRYELFPHDSPKFPDVYAIANPGLGVFYQDPPPACWKDPNRTQPRAWGRTAILLHKAYDVHDVVGCIGVGKLHIFYNMNLAVIGAGEVFPMLRKALGTGTHALTIVPSIGARDPQ